MCGVTRRSSTLRAAVSASVDFTTDDARDGKVLHAHEGRAFAVLTADGKLRIFGYARDSAGHGHNIDREFDDTSLTKFDFKTSKAGDEEHDHLVHVELESPLEVEEELGETDVVADAEEEAAQRSEEAEAAPAEKPAKAKTTEARSHQLLLRKPARLPGYKPEAAAKYFRSAFKAPQKSPNRFVCSDGAGWLRYSPELRKARLLRLLRAGSPRVASLGQATYRFVAPSPLLELLGSIDISEGPKPADVANFFDERNLLVQMAARTGLFRHFWHGKIEFNDEYLDETIENFFLGVICQFVVANPAHNRDLGGHGIIVDLKRKPHTYEYVNEDKVLETHNGSALWRYTALTHFGWKQLIRDMKYFYNSVEHASEYREREILPSTAFDETDPESDIFDLWFGPVTHQNVLVGCADCDDPFLHNMAELGLKPGRDEEDEDMLQERLIASRFDGDHERYLDGLREELLRRNPGVPLHAE